MLQAKLASPVERLELVLLGMARDTPARELCRQAGVSRELFYRWMKQAREAALMALEKGKPGPKPEREPEEEAKRLAETVERLRREKAKLVRQRSRLKLVLRQAKQVFRRNGWDDTKKNGER